MRGSLVLIPRTASVSPHFRTVVHGSSQYALFFQLIHRKVFVNDTTHDLAKHGEDSINKAAGQAQRGIEQTASRLSSNVESARQSAKPLLDQASDAAAQLRSTATQASDSIISYTQDNPVKALLFAAAGGALLLTLIKALTPARD
jgi:ElaB/YqjD/DUF883 family membrane-anchored ribosome-binding protein